MNQNPNEECGHDEVEDCVKEERIVNPIKGSMNLIPRWAIID